MYKVFIVDDEIVVREGIRNRIKLKDNEFIFSGEASDGETALAKIKETKPDILITDIKMPFLDGLQLSKIVKQSMPWMKLIILSGYDEFDFAKEAISIGVTEYLLKPISSQDLINTLNKVAQQIKIEKEEHEKFNNIKKQIQNNIPIIKEKFLSDIVFGAVSKEQIIEKCEFYKIDIMSKYYVIEIIEWEFKNKSIENSTTIKIDNQIFDFLQNFKNVISFKRTPEQIVLIVKSNCKNTIIFESKNIAAKLKSELNKFENYLLCISIGSIQEDIKGISLSFFDAEIAMKYKFVIGINKIISTDDVKLINDKKDHILKLEKINLSDFYKYGDSSNIDEFLNNYIQNMNNAESIIYIYYSLVDIILISANFVKELNGELINLIPDISNIEGIVTEIDSINKFKIYSKKILQSVFDFRDNKIKNKYGNVIQKAKDYIDKNFTDPEISLNSVSSHVNVSSSHFSTVFSHETNETFIEYLTNKRIMKAKELLKTTSKRSSEIAYEIGYNDPRYFSYLFKRITKLTPIEFRNNKQ